MIPGIEIEALERALSAATGSGVQVVNARALADSSRAAPWRIDVAVGGQPDAYLLRTGEGCSANEAVALRAMADHPIPTPRLVLWDERGVRCGTPVFVSEWIEGDALLPVMRTGEQWAIDLYLDTVCALQAVGPDELPPGTVGDLRDAEPIRDVIESAYARFPEREPLHEAAYRRLIDGQPEVPETAFSNGDLWPENLLVKGRDLAGVIDWQHAGWSDPIFEFLLVFFLVPELRGRGIEAAFCARKGYDSTVLPWYHGVEFFDSLALVLRTGKPYEMHTAETLTRDLEEWMESPG